MFGKSIVLFELFGFKVRADASWLLLAVLITWSLATGLFPHFHPGFAAAVYWRMAVVGMAGLFASLVLHELAHSLVARHFGLPIKGITLFIFGGVAEMEEEPASPKVEFLMAIAGPAMSFALALACYLLATAVRAGDLGQPLFAVLGYLAWINGLLAAFNLVPAFPLDGGRVLRAALWHWKGDYNEATRLACGGGQAFGLLLILLGLWSLLSGNFVGGLWWFLIGLFLRGAASAAYGQLIARQVFRGVPVSRYMTADPVSVPLHVSLADFVDDYVYRYHHEFFPVVRDDGRLLGYVTTKQIKGVPREHWAEARIADVYVRLSAEVAVAPNTDAARALTIMRRSGNSRLLVVEQDRLVGLITLKDLLEFLGLKMDLEGR